ncbi:MAG TPA: heavy metal-binding domain-containing protein [Dehalococcoidia bacterium]|nr:heavy metal-binding domain-containing protein [Dehalococcoidia bacterium]
MTNAGSDDAETAALSASSREALERGALPLEAQRRLAQETKGRRFFASDLSVDELLLVQAEGFEPLGLVMGSSIYHLGWQWTQSWGWNPVQQELEVVTGAHLHARQLAMGRMEQEAAALGAHGVVGVRFTIAPYEGDPEMLEFIAIGTAVRRRSAAAADRPFVSDLSGEDFWTLLQAGYEPLGLAMGFSSYYVLPNVLPYAAGSFWSYGNQELPAFATCVYEARRNAMQRLEDDLRRLGAEGVTAVQMSVERKLGEQDRNNTHYLSLRVDFFVMGTAIRRSSRLPQMRQQAVPALNMTGVRPVRGVSGSTPPELRLRER